MAKLPTSKIKSVFFYAATSILWESISSTFTRTTRARHSFPRASQERSASHLHHELSVYQKEATVPESARPIKPSQWASPPNWFWLSAIGASCKTTKIFRRRLPLLVEDSRMHHGISYRGSTRLKRSFLWTCKSILRPLKIKLSLEQQDGA